MRCNYPHTDEDDSTILFTDVDVNNDIISTAVRVIVINDVINDLIDEGYCGRLEGGDLLP